MDVILKSKIIDNLDTDLHVNVYGVEICYEFVMFLQLGTSGVNKPAIWLDGGIHAREWIAVAAALNIIDKVSYGKSH